jgi:hypothetical protein
VTHLGNRSRRILLGLALALAAAACGGGGDDDCAGYITINATPEQCAAIAEKYGCASYDVTGPSCGLTACVTCTDL